MKNLMASTKNKPTHNLFGANVLVVDDNHASRLVAKAILEREGCIVTLAENGVNSVEIAANNPFNLILMDIQMPDITGVEAACRIKASNKQNVSTPIIALTAYSDHSIRNEAREAGILEMLTKPLRVGQIQSALNRVHTQDKALAAERPIPNFITELSFTEIGILNTSIIAPLVEKASPDMLGKLYERFNISANSFLLTIEDCAHGVHKNEVDVLDKLRKAAHALKGAAASVGFARLSAQAARVQNANLSELADTIASLRNLLLEANAELATYLASPKAGP